MAVRDPDSATTPHDTSGFVVRALSVRVVAGPDAGKRVDATGEQLSVGTAEGNDLVLTDPTVSRYHFELRQSGDRIILRDNASTNGVEAGGVLVESGVVMPGAILRIGRTKLKIEDAGSLTLEASEDAELGGLWGRSAVMRRLMLDIRAAGRTSASVLVQGETGTGKEVVAAAIHQFSARAAAPFEIVDCGTLVPSLIASDLFGHERGAFTGADATKIGAFERANGGTLFLDEIGELPPALQPALLGVIERRAFRRVGGDKLIPVDVRIVAATHRDLRAEVNASRFRQDLYFRLAVMKLRVPALRERLEDVPLLVEHFLRQAGHEGQVGAMLSSEAMTALQGHQWPGNVRELRNFVEASLAAGEPAELQSFEDAEEPPSAPLSASAEADASLPELIPFRDAQAAFERTYVDRLMAEVDGNVSKGARVAKIHRSFLRLMLARQGRGR